VTLGASIFLIAVGAILKFAVNVSSSSIDLDVIGVILMAAGAIGLLISLFLYTTATSRRANGTRVVERETTREI